MATINRMVDKEECKIIRSKVEEALKVLGEAGYQARIGNGRYDDTKLTLKIDITRAGVDPEEAEFAKVAHLFGFKREDYRKETTVGSLGEVRLIALKPQSPKFPIIVQKVRSCQRYKLSEKQYHGQ